MTQPTPRMGPADRESLRRRLLVDRPLHWDLARAMFAALEAAWDELERVRTHADGRIEPEDTHDDGGDPRDGE